MNPFPATPELRAVAERVVWFKEPSAALADPVHFLAHVMTYGTVEDLAAVARAGIGLEYFRAVLKAAPAGVFDARSWAYWHERCGIRLRPPLPARAGLVASPPQP